MTERVYLHYGYGPGTATCHCRTCGTEFRGHPQADRCESCSTAWAGHVPPDKLIEVLRCIGLRYGPTRTLDDCVALAQEALADLGLLDKVAGRAPVGLDAAMRGD
ncbi:hypothetical protein [Azospirillum sp. TSO5]|uniref:hypothetical protein n=1 Tax=Azospirillum sp. TSO5 TaxID=716760 RepID=UPI000D619D00|nr:hypothetical protein [Azospirillum sp. TSO5]PWC98052.1 hypothetical protein TSO5_03355 [Azospirillum sp. TSO5]